MKLTDFLIHKKNGQSNNINLKKDFIVFNDINALFKLNNWQYVNLDEFDNFIEKYNFPKHKEYSKKDQNEVRGYFPKPQILLTKAEEKTKIRVALALYKKEILTGKTLLNLRSINKFEQMEIRYFLKFTSAPINEPKIQKREFYEFCQSGDIYFDFDFIDESKFESARLRIITFSFNDYIILMYAFDQNSELTQEDLNLLIESFKSSC